MIPVGPENLEDLAETVAVMSDPELMSRIRHGQEDAARGRVSSLEEVRAELARSAEPD